MVSEIRSKLFVRGQLRTDAFCSVNGLDVPEVRKVAKNKWEFDSTCAYYRPTYIAICVERCALPGLGGRSWSWPGYVVDRTPFGVLQHELGHHADIALSGMKTGYQGTFSKSLRKETGEEPITTYCPNDAEWFAEIFRLFVTNADLLRLIRPKTHEKLVRVFKPVSAKEWKAEIAGAPQRYFNAAQRKIDRYYDL